MADQDQTGSEELDTTGDETSSSKTVSPSQTQGLTDDAAVGDARARAAQIRSQQGGKAQYDETIRGGRYVNARGQFVNAHGELIDEDGNVLEKDESAQSGTPDTQ